MTCPSRSLAAFRSSSLLIGLALYAVPIGCTPSGSTSETTDTEADTETSPPSTSDSSTSTASDPGTDSTAATDTDEPDLETAGELPDECFDRDPAVDASFTLELPDWGLGDFYDFTAECTVSALVEAGATLRTELTCDHEGVERSAALEIAAPFSAAPTWAAGEAVQLRAHRFESNELSKEIDHLVRLQRSPSDLLVLAIDGSPLGPSHVPDSSWYAPISLEIDTSLCGGYPELVDPTPQQLLRGVVEDCCEGDVRGGQRALVDLSGAYSGFDVDAARVEVDAVGDPGDHNTNHLEVVIRAVDIGI